MSGFRLGFQADLAGENFRELKRKLCGPSKLSALESLDSAAARRAPLKLIPGEGGGQQRMNFLETSASLKF